MIQIEHTNLLKTLILLNRGNVGSAKIAEKVGWQAIAISSCSIAIAHGYEDGQCFRQRHNSFFYLFNAHVG